MISITAALYDLHSIDDSKLSIAAVMARYQDKWIFDRCKGETTWQIPGGQREENKNIRQAASRELIEETGAEQFSLIPICIKNRPSQMSIPYFLKKLKSLREV